MGTLPLEDRNQKEKKKKKVMPRQNNIKQPLNPAEEVSHFPSVGLHFSISKIIK